ncbi:hypothetical protein [Acetomicrobium sp. S15 = DSM 107314]|uniref:hypothetical protein n=1 Tax=Acetomicrobium sp. S15 = DSM 107314 TaxID=2529858 RepID=UPI0018E1636C|nr:hypothetical protein [Acetomicrobium sp. S15 = DSM 107314]
MSVSVSVDAKARVRVRVRVRVDPGVKFPRFRLLKCPTMAENKIGLFVKPKLKRISVR